ncbi:hypothetical protein G7Z17_g8346 [Cylindrodendrum hubeiense]|uniref:Rhodopsin domain-containing protein n=1 Tax=Cylindrodendrum hubeiense TaxID=595255 RepID=A0A9P5LEE3_9HYPO|nr:hypothetical protein G7Z17_g8346 [Cylindrodendrum hubeiense]
MIPLDHNIAARATESDAESSAIPLITGPFPPLNQYGKSLVAASVIMVAFTTAWTVMRIISRNIRKTQYHVEDYLYFAGQILYYGVAASFILAVAVGGAGNDMSRLDPSVITNYSRIALACQLLYALCLGFIKIAVICMIRRIFRTAGLWFIVATWAVTAMCIAWSMYTIILPFVICKPVESAWGGAVPEECGDNVKAYAAVAVLDIISEVSIVALPMKMVYDLQMNRAHKVALLGVFGAGFVTIVFSCVRLYYVYNIDFNNITKSFAEASISSILQSGIAVMVASSPMLRPVFDRTALRWLGISLRSSQKDSSARAARSQSNGGGAGRMGLGPSHPRSTGFKQMPESEEHLAWELGPMDGKFSEQKTTVQATRASDESINEQSRQIENGTQSPTFLSKAESGCRKAKSQNAKPMLCQKSRDFGIAQGPRTVRIGHLIGTPGATV